MLEERSYEDDPVDWDFVVVVFGELTFVEAFRLLKKEENRNEEAF